MNSPPGPSKFRVIRATYALFTSSSCFADEYAHQLERGRVEAEEQSRRRLHGLAPHPSSPAGERELAEEARAYLIKSLSRSTMASATATAIALIVTALLGDLGPSFPFHAGKTLQVIGGALALCGTLYAFQGPARSLGGTSAPEVVHAFVFTCLLSVGGALAILGTLL